jgi:hypothetical protein
MKKENTRQYNKNKRDADLYALQRLLEAAPRRGNAETQGMLIARWMARNQTSWNRSLAGVVKTA